MHVRSHHAGAAARSRAGRQGELLSERRRMSRISIKTKAELPADLRPLWEKMRAFGDFEHQAGVMAHRPPIFMHVFMLLKVHFTQAWRNALCGACNGFNDILQIDVEPEAVVRDSVQ